MKNNENLSTLLNGIIKENPVLVLILGTCPTLATTNTVDGAFGMGLAALVVLVCSNVFISLLRKVIPETMRIPCYIVLIAGFVTLVEMLMHAFTPALYASLGIFLSLIVVNCIILGRAEMYASKNNVVDSAIDAVGMGIGFTLALFCMATIREVLGNGSFMGLPIPILSENPISIFALAPGGFFVFGCLIALVNKLTKNQKPRSLGCAGCPSAALCAKVSCEAQQEDKA